ncbi:CE1759 family FMN reductase [Brachybacterium sp. DNPG3]
MTAPIRLAVIAAGLSTPSSTRMLADQLAQSVREQLTAAPTSDAGSPATPEVEIRTIELREIAHEITDMMLTRFPGERLAQAIDAVRTADAVIAVTPIFNIGPSGLFKSFVDALDKELWAGRPVLIGATAGTARHSLAIDFALRPMFAYLHADVASTAVFAASADFGADTEGQADEQPLSARVRRAAGELAALIRARRADLGGTAAGPTAGSTAGSTASSADEQAEGADRTEAAGPATGLDPEFADFVPMGTLLHR